MSSKLKIVVLSGAGVSAESGIQTFRDAGGLWEGHDVMEVATPEGFKRRPELVLEFYNQRRKQAKSVKPNTAHELIASWEKWADVNIVTQNVDNLHERAGSSKVLHLHGSLFESRSTKNPSLVFKMERDEIHVGDLCPQGSQLRPNIVWFGEAVPNMSLAAELVAAADVLLVVGTSLQVYPAAGLIHEAQPNALKIILDPNANDLGVASDWHKIVASAVNGIHKAEQLIFD